MIFQIDIIHNPRTDHLLEVGNFELLITMLREADGIQMLESADTLSAAIGEMLNDLAKSQSLAKNAKSVLSSHAQSVEKTVG